MKYFNYFKRMLAIATCVGVFSAAACAEDFNIPPQDLASALNTYTKQTGIALVISGSEVQNARTKGVKGKLSADEALVHILAGTGFVTRRDSGAVVIVRDYSKSSQLENSSIHLAAASAPTVEAAALETVTVTSSKIGGDVQNIPISITAMSQEQLTQTQTAGGPDLVKQVPNLTFSKTNFTGYNIEIRGIGTQAISVTTDPAVAVAFNDIPFIRNHFFEQEFYDVSQVEVLRGPQGTVYGRNATAGVVNLVSAKPTDQFEAMASADFGNYQNRRLEGMLNIPIVGDKLDLRVAGEWTKRKGYTFNEQTDESVDGRDLWSGRMSVLVHPFEALTANFIWEHFSEDDDRLRSGKQLCTKAPAPSVINGPAGSIIPDADLNYGNGGALFLSQGCQMGPLYGPTSFETPDAEGIPFISLIESLSNPYIPPLGDPYAGVSQSQNLRVIDSQLEPRYTSKNDTFEINADYAVTSALTLTSQTGYNKDSLYSTEDYNRFNTAPNLFQDVVNEYGGVLVGQDGQFCDPQLGCSTRLIGEDVSEEQAYQFSQELRLASNFSGPLNFGAGGNFLHYQTVEDYFVFFNAITILAENFNNNYGGYFFPDGPHIAFDPVEANACGPTAPPADLSTIGRVTPLAGIGCGWIDPNPLSQIDGQGHNYFRSENPYRLNSFAGFGEVYYQVAPDVKLTGGLRWTDDRKHFVEIPSWVLIAFKGYPVAGVLDQEWKEFTGRFVANWTPKLDFTDQSLFYGSYSRGYKGGGANPPGVIPICFGTGISCLTSPSDTAHPLAFKPEFVDAFELGTKNTLLDGAMTFNADVFYYKYQNYQISEIVDRTSVNLNFNADVKGAEIESTWEPIPGLRFNLAGGYENTRLANGSQAIDLIDRAAGHSDWIVVKPFITETSNCILPVYVVDEYLAHGGINSGCLDSYSGYYSDPTTDPITRKPYVADPDPVNLPGYIGFNPDAAPNHGEGFFKDLSGNQLPNAPPFTLSVGGQYSMPLSEDWAGTARADGYWQGNSFARVFNDKPYDQLHGYANLNLTLIFTNQNGWQAMAYMKNVFNTTAITGAFLNSDDTGLTTNVFTTDPRLFGLRVTKNW